MKYFFDFKFIGVVFLGDGVVRERKYIFVDVFVRVLSILGLEFCDDIFAI